MDGRETSEERGRGKRADKTAEATFHTTTNVLTDLFKACCGEQWELTEEYSLLCGLGFWRSENPCKLHTILYYLIITLQEQISHFASWLSRARAGDKGLENDGVHRRAMDLWRAIKEKNEEISMPGALVGAFAVIV